MEETIARLFQFTVAIGVAFGVVLWFALTVWAYRDIQTRSNNVVVQIFSTLVVLLGFLPGAAIYLLLRPRETIEESFQRTIEEEYLAHELSSLPVCPTCQYSIRDEYIYCPNCGSILRESCQSCGRLVDANWLVCAYCGMDQPRRRQRRTEIPNGRYRVAPPQDVVRSSSQAQVGSWDVDLDDVESVSEETGELPEVVSGSAQQP